MRFQSKWVRTLALVAGLCSIALTFYLTGGMTNLVWKLGSDVTIIPAPPPEAPASKLTESELRSSDQVIAFKAKVNKTLSQIRQTCTQLHVAYIGSQTFSPSEGHAMGYVVTSLSSPELSYYERSSHDDLTEQWVNTKFQDTISSRPDGKQDEKYIPRWSSDQALVIAEAFLKSFDKISDLKLEKPQVKFLPSDNRAWGIEWRRRDSKGHPYHNDWVILDIPDGCGPLELRCHITLSEPKIKDAYLSEEAAASIARKYAQTIDKTESFTLSEGSLEIVNGNAGTCLAWIFSIGWASNTGWTPPTVFIDAQTGKVVGGETWA